MQKEKHTSMQKDRHADVSSTVVPAKANTSAEISAPQTKNKRKRKEKVLPSTVVPAKDEHQCGYNAIALGSTIPGQ